MNLRNYFEKIRELEQKIAGDHAVVVSHETPDGGKAGARTEVPRRLAAKMVVDGVAHLAEPDEAETFRKAQAQAAADARERAAAANIQLTVVPAADLEAVRRAAKAKA
jgi:hypothetical protein